MSNKFDFNRQSKGSSNHDVKELSSWFDVGLTTILIHTGCPRSRRLAGNGLLAIYLVIIGTYQKNIKKAFKKTRISRPKIILVNNAKIII